MLIGTIFLNQNGLVILDSMAFLSKIENKYIKWLLAVLNSDLIYFWVKSNVHEYGNTGFRLSNQYVEQIPIPFLSNSELENLCDFFHPDSAVSDNRLQKFIYTVYGINIEEQNFIKNKLYSKV